MFKSLSRDPIAIKPAAVRDWKKHSRRGRGVLCMDRSEKGWELTIARTSMHEARSSDKGAVRRSQRRQRNYQRDDGSQNGGKGDACIVNADRARGRHGGSGKRNEIRSVDEKVEQDDCRHTYYDSNWQLLGLF